MRTSSTSKIPPPKYKYAMSIDAHDLWGFCRSAEVFEDQPPVDPLVQVGGADVLGKWYFAASQAPVLVAKESPP
eukprot:3327224-Amphidinium_carterae.1